MMESWLYLRDVSGNRGKGHVERHNPLDVQDGRRICDLVYPSRPPCTEPSRRGVNGSGSGNKATKHNEPSDGDRTEYHVYSVLMSKNETVLLLGHGRLFRLTNDHER